MTPDHLDTACLVGFVPRASLPPVLLRSVLLYFPQFLSTLILFVRHVFRVLCDVEVGVAIYSGPTDHYCGASHGAPCAPFPDWAGPESLTGWTPTRVTLGHVGTACHVRFAPGAAHPPVLMCFVLLGIATQRLLWDLMDLSQVAHARHTDSSCLIVSLPLLYLLLQPPPSGTAHKQHMDAVPRDIECLHLWEEP